MTVVAAITGGMGSGKSLVYSLFLELGAFGIDCDVLSREAVRPCTRAWWLLIEHFGKDILRRDLELDRKRLREIIVADSAKRRYLEAIIHPEVMAMCRARIEAIKKIEPEAPLIVVDIPLLIEAGFMDKFDAVILVYVSEAEQLKRVMEREGVDEHEARKLIALQMPLNEKLKFADVVINNEGTIEETSRQVRLAFHDLLRSTAQNKTKVWLRPRNKQVDAVQKD